jgi:hypothetical protein
MCFNWSEQAKTGQPDALEYLVHRLGPILARRTRTEGTGHERGM